MGDGGMVTLYNPIDILFFMALLTLIMHTYTDLKRGTIDPKKNFGMTYANVVAAIVLGLVGQYIMAVIFTVIAFITIPLLLHKFGIGNPIGAGDQDCLSWLIPMLALVNLELIFAFLGLLLLFSIPFAWQLKRKNIERAPAMAVIFLAFFVSSGLHYWLPIVFNTL